MPMHRVELEWVEITSSILSTSRNSKSEKCSWHLVSCNRVKFTFHSPTPQHLYLKRFEQATHNSSCDFVIPARGSQSFEAAWRFRRRRRGQDATSIGSTVVGLDILAKDLRQVFSKLNATTCNAITFNYCNWVQLVSATIHDCIMQFQCVNTCESWPDVVLHLPSIQ